tara:strand:- start:4749 stop:4910 length:162 start_codon:yes stop_codon:yes gene_type:complete
MSLSTCKGRTGEALKKCKAMVAAKKNPIVRKKQQLFNKKFSVKKPFKNSNNNK